MLVKGNRGGGGGGVINRKQNVLNKTTKNVYIPR